MTTEEAALLDLLAGNKGGACMLSDLSRRNKAIAGRLQANTNYIRIVSDCACLTEPGRSALRKHRIAFGT